MSEEYSKLWGRNNASSLEKSARKFNQVYDYRQFQGEGGEVKYNHLIGLNGAACGYGDKNTKWSRYNPSLPKCEECLAWLKALSWAEVEVKP